MAPFPPDLPGYHMSKAAKCRKNAKPYGKEDSIGHNTAQDTHTPMIVSMNSRNHKGKRGEAVLLPY